MNTPTPESRGGSQLSSAIVWTLGALVVAIFAFVRAGEHQDKQIFYVIAGVVATILVVVNGYSAWQAYQESKTPPAVR